MLSVSIVIAAFNEEKNINECLDSLQNLDYDSSQLEIIVVDNNSTDNTANIVKKYPVNLVQEKTSGPTYARNKGIQTAKNEIIVFIDSDVKVSQGWLKQLIAPFDDQSIGAVGGRILPKKPNLISDYLGYALFGKYKRDLNPQYEISFPSCNLAIRRNLIGSGFDTTLPIYAEDIDLTLRISNQGYKIYYNPEALIYHEHPDSIIQLFRYWKKSTKGRFVYCKKYPHKKTCRIMNFNIFTIHLLTLLISLILAPLYILSIAPIYLILLIRFLKEVKSEKDSLSLIITVPFINLISIYTISLYFTLYKLKVLN